MANFDPTTATADPTQFDPSSAAPLPPPAPTSAPAEIGHGFVRGALVNLPTMAGQALQFAGANGAGTALRDFGQSMASSPWTAAHPEQHGTIVNALASGAEQIAPVLAPVGAAAGAIAAAPVELPAIATLGAGAAAGGALAAGATGQQTLEKAQAKGLSPEAAQDASRLNAATTFATQVGLGMVGGRVLGAATAPLARMVGMEAPTMAADVLSQLSGTSGILAPTLKAAAAGGAEAVGLGAAQAAASAGIEQHYGVDDTSPLDAALQSIPSMLGMTAIMTPFGLAGRALGARAAVERTGTLASADTDVAQRTELAQQYAASIAQRSGDKNAATAFLQNAQYAIDNKQPLPVSADMFTPGQARIPDIMAANERGENNPLPVGQQEMFGQPPAAPAAGQGELFGQPPAAEPQPEVPTAQPGQLPLDLQPPEHDSQAELNFWNSGTELVPATPTIQVGSGGNATTPEQRAALAQDAAQGRVGPSAQTRAVVPATPTIQVNSEGVATTPAQRAAGTPALTPMERVATTPQAQALHAQIRDELTAAGETPASPLSRADFYKSDVAQGLTGQARARAYSDYLNAPSTLVTMMREDADAYAALKQREAAEAQQTPVTNPLVEGTPAAERTNTQLSDAMATAQRRAQEDAAYAQVEQQRAAETNTIANRTQGEALAGAAERGEVQPDLNAAKGSDEIMQDVAEVNGTNGFDTKSQSMVPFTKRLDALGLDQADTHDAQITKLSDYLNDKSVKMSDTMRDRMSALLAKWQAERPAAAAPVEETPTPAAPEVPATNPAEPAPELAGTPPAQAEGLPANIPASVETPAPAQAAALPDNMPVTADANTEQPPQANALPENVTQSAQSHAQDTADMVDATLAQFNTRLRSGEQLTPLEQERMEDLQGFRNALSEVTSGNNVSDDYAQSISDMAREAATTPYEKSFRRYATPNPEATDPAIMFDSLATGKMQDTLNTIGQRGSTPEVQALAQRLAPLLPDTTIKYAAPHPSGAIGQFRPDLNHVNIFPGGESEATILHEATHAAQYAQVERAQQIGTPRTQAEARLKSAYNEIESIRQEALRRTGSDEYGLTDAHEFLAELNANPEFQQFLKDAQTRGRSLWQRAVGAVKNLLGMQTKGFLERAMDANQAFFRETPDTAGFPLTPRSDSYARFMRSPKDAADVTDEQYSKMTKVAERTLKTLPSFDRMNLATYSKALGWVTKQYIVERLEAIPKLVDAGFAAAARAHYAADEGKRIAGNRVQNPLADYVRGVQHVFKGMTGDAQRALSQQMKIIGAEASRGGFDFRMNYADNVKAGREIPPQNKPYVDDIHRQYTQLQRTNPDAARAIETGALQNARLNTMTVATLVRNLIHYSGDATMQPHDARLDFMDKTLDTGRNPDAARYADAGHAALDKRLEQAFTTARTLPEGSVLRDQLNELSDMYHAQQRDPYYALGRDGDYFVKTGFKPGMDAATQARLQQIALQHGHVLGNLNDADHAFFRVDTIDEANGLARKLEAAGGRFIDGATSARGKLADRIDSVYGVNPALRSILSNLHDTVERSGLSGDAAAAVRDTITRQVLSLLPESSSRSAKMNRKGIPGYSADFLGDFQKRAGSGAQDLANIHMQPAFDAARDGMDAAIEKLARSGDADLQTRAQMAADELNLRHMNLSKPVDNSTINTINSLGHTFFLAMSPAYILRTMAQPFHRGVPITGSRFGFVKAAQSMAGATATAMRVIQNTIADGYSENGLRGILNADASFRNLGLPKNEQAFLQELHDRGFLNLGQTRQVQHMNLTGSQLQQDLQRMAAMTAQYAEMGNRMVVALSAFRLAEAAGNKEGLPAKSAENTEYAIKVAKQSMDDFDPANTARNISKNAPVTGKLTPLLTAFMNYNLQTMQQIARTVHDGMFNQDLSAAGKQRAAEAKREFGGLMATTAMISGALGLPFMSVAAGLYNWAMNDNNDPHDIRIDAQNFLDKYLGHTLGGVVAHGIPHAAGFDSSTFGLENLLPGSEFLASRRLLKDRIADQSSALMGPALNAGTGIAEGMDKMADGYYVKGIEAMLPSGLKALYKAGELATRGYTDSKENPVAMNPITPDNPHGNKATWGQVALQAVGFRTARAADVSEAQQFAGARQDRLDYQRGLIEDQFYKNALNPDADRQAAATTALTRFNTANPMTPVRDVGQSVRQRLMGLALAGALGTGINMASPRQAVSLGRQLMFETDNNGGYGMP